MVSPVVTKALHILIKVINVRLKVFLNPTWTKKSTAGFSAINSYLFAL